MKLRMERLHVEADERGVPQRLYWRGRWYQVREVLDEWRYAGKWWIDGFGWRRLYYRVRARDRRHEVTIELFRQGSVWVLSRQDD
jgi:hypothetical protein